MTDTTASAPGPHESPGDVLAVRRALVSVSDKHGLDELAKGLAEAGVELVSTGSTAEQIRAAGVTVTDVSEITGFPEIMDGRVKTLHPAVHAGILADRSKAAHRAALEEHAVTPIDLVVVNLYPFEEALAAQASASDELVELIDIGGPAMVRAAAKNHAHVAVIVEPEDYRAVLDELEAHGGISGAARRRLAGKAFARTAAYDAAVAGWLEGEIAEPFPERLATSHRRALTLRYGENPHQRAAYYVDAGRPWGLGAARQLHGKELSYNNLLDADGAWGAVSDFAEPCVVIVKHTNPAGIAIADTLAEAYPRALAGDPVSAFGGIVAANRAVDEQTARQIAEVFTEVVIAPAFTEGALGVLTGKVNLRLLELTAPEPPPQTRAVRSVSGGLLVQDADVGPEQEETWSVPTAAKPSDDLLAELRFAWTACKHTKSNAIVLSRDRSVVGVGAGQMSRVDSVRLAVEKADGREVGAVLASDAFFPFRDGPDAALDAGVVAIIQPGGSVRDEEVVAACDERGVPMVCTGRRHFRH